MLKPQRICLIGAEGTGKSTMAQALAAHFGGLWVPDSWRMCCELQGRAPRLDELRQRIGAQFSQEENAVARATQAGAAYVFCDTAPLLTGIYSDFYFADNSLLDSAHALHGRYALSLVLRPDFPWQPDRLQCDSAAVRAAIHSRVLHELQGRRYPHIEVSGCAADRLQGAILAVETLNG